MRPRATWRDVLWLTAGALVGGWFLWDAAILLLTSIAEPSPFGALFAVAWGTVAFLVTAGAWPAPCGDASSRTMSTGTDIGPARDTSASTTITRRSRPYYRVVRCWNHATGAWRGPPRWRRSWGSWHLPGRGAGTARRTGPPASSSTPNRGSRWSSAMTGRCASTDVIRYPDPRPRRWSAESRLDPAPGTDVYRDQREQIGLRVPSGLVVVDTAAPQFS